MFNVKLRGFDYLSSEEIRRSEIIDAVAIFLDSKDEHRFRIVPEPDLSEMISYDFPLLNVMPFPENFEDVKELSSFIKSNSKHGKKDVMNVMLFPEYCVSEADTIDNIVQDLQNLSLGLKDAYAFFGIPSKERYGDFRYIYERAFLVDLDSGQLMTHRKHNLTDGEIATNNIQFSTTRNEIMSTRWVEGDTYRLRQSIGSMKAEFHICCDIITDETKADIALVSAHRLGIYHDEMVRSSHIEYFFRFMHSLKKPVVILDTSGLGFYYIKPNDRTIHYQVV